MIIEVNGKEVPYEREITINELLDQQNVEMKDYVTVQINEQFVDREVFNTTYIKENDKIEFLYFMGGGRS